jgi:S-adenosylmethionine:tRNA ribosyltransferase-isomerase
MVRPGRRLGPGAVFEIDGVPVDVLEDLGDGTRLIRMSDEGVIRDSGEIPLPPYIHTPLADGERYQTVYASAEGSAAAPTAGLHFTPELLEDLRLRGVRIAQVTLHVGIDTFRPVRSERPGKHKLHSEYFQLGEQAALEINQAKADGRRIICVGTTSVRLLEQAALLAEEQGSVTLAAASGWADLFILPGHRFRLVDGLITNFHLPRSTLLMLVAAFAGRDHAGDAGREIILRAYQEAIEGGYRFYSFGDCMMVL